MDLPGNDPYLCLEQWMEEAIRSEPSLPEAASLATVDSLGQPSARMVLVRGISTEGFDFFTNYTSRKAADLESCPTASLLFHWKSIECQIRLEGGVKRLDPAASDDYWSTRPRGSQLAAWASRQSEAIDGGRQALLERFHEIEVRFPEGPIPRPEFWGGYRLVPVYYEFWRGRDNRLHDRIEFRRHRGEDAWTRRHLQP